VTSNWAVKWSRDLLLKYLDPFISWQRLKLESSNLAQRLIAECFNETKNAKLGQRGRWRYSCQISQTDWSQRALSKNCKIMSYWVVKGSRERLLKFRYPVHIIGTVEARNFKFGKQIGIK